MIAVSLLKESFGWVDRVVVDTSPSIWTHCGRLKISLNSPSTSALTRIEVKQLDIWMEMSIYFTRYQTRTYLI